MKFLFWLVFDKKTLKPIIFVNISDTIKMENNRLLQLLNFLAEEPDEPFNIYAVALEYLNIDVNQAQIYLEKLRTKHPEYVPTYYQLAKLYADKEEISQAKAVYEQGLQVAHNQNDTKAYHELQKAYQQLLFEEEM
jgi:tetratricopeptide (TPR) repeat protein